MPVAVTVEPAFEVAVKVTLLASPNKPPIIAIALTFATLVVKGVSYALAAGFVYKLMSKKHPSGAVFCSAMVAPIVNTAVFLIGCRLFIWPSLVAMAGANGVGMGMLLFGMAGMNFIIEFVLNVILCPSILRIIDIAKDKFRR